MPNLRTPVKNYYEILGVAANAPADEIKMAFRRLARRYHPDVNPNDKSAEEKFKQINEAYDVLSDETKRQQYELQFFNGSKRKKYPRSSNENQGKRDFDFPQFGKNMKSTGHLVHIDTQQRQDLNPHIDALCRLSSQAE